MAETQVQDPSTAPAPAVTQVADPTTATTEPNEPNEPASEKTYTQGDIDKRVTQALETRDAQHAVKVQEAKEKAEKQAAEAKLLEDGELEKLANLKAQEADDANAKLAKYERDIKVDALLDKQEVLDPNMRSLFKATGLEIEELNPMIEGFKAQFDAAVKAAVDKQLKNDPPPQTTTQTAIDPGDLDAQILAAQKQGKLLLSAQLKRQKHDMARG